MEALVRCENCRTPLRVPTQACGRRARCPSCGQSFVLPSSDQLLEETFSSWIEEDVDDLFSDRVTENDGLPTPQTPAAPSPAAQDRFAAETPPVVPIQQAPPRPATTAATSHQPPNHTSAPTAQSVQQSADPDNDTDNLTFPQNLDVTESIPHLVVEKLDHVGVHFIFDSVWLEHDGFRASMPVRCVFSGDSVRQDLLARPMIFFDQYVGRRDQTTPADITNEYEQRASDNQDPREIVEQMSRLQNMQYPYDLPLLYYVSTLHTHQIIECATHHRNGRTVCRVTIPDDSTALDWLGNVNGICGDDYRILQHNVSMRHGEVWQKLTERCRQRITVWCKLHPREEVRLYLIDADFGRHDEGLAGLVLTDQRLIFCKYHRRGSVSRRNANATILVHLKSHSADLRLCVGTETTRIVSLHRQDVNPLVAELKNNQGLTIKLKTGSRG